MSRFTKYRLYQKYETRGSQEAIPCYPNVFSINGDGTMPLVIVEEQSRDCGYTGDTQPIYRWYNMPIDKYWYCDECASSFKWLATYYDGHTQSAACDSSSAITQGEITLTSLVSLQIGDCVDYIGFATFESCTSLTSVTIPNSVTSIGDWAFNNCRGLTSITVEATTPPTLGSHVFDNMNNCPIYVPSESVNAYKTANYWNNYASRIQAIP